MKVDLTTETLKVTFSEQATKTLALQLNNMLATELASISINESEDKSEAVVTRLEVIKALLTNEDVIKGFQASVSSMSPRIVELFQNTVGNTIEMVLAKYEAEHKTDTTPSEDEEDEDYDEDSCFE